MTEALTLAPEPLGGVLPPAPALPIFASQNSENDTGREHEQRVKTIVEELPEISFVLPSEPNEWRDKMGHDLTVFFVDGYSIDFVFVQVKSHIRDGRKFREKIGKREGVNGDPVKRWERIQEMRFVTINARNTISDEEIAARFQSQVASIQSIEKQRRMGMRPTQIFP